MNKRPILYRPQDPIRIEKAMPEPFGIKGIWEGAQIVQDACSTHGGLTDDDLLKVFKAQRDRDYQQSVDDGNPYKKSLLDHIKTLPCDCLQGGTPILNTVCDGLVNTILERMVGTHTGTQDLIGRKMVVGNNATTAPLSTDTQLILEHYRADFDDNVRVDNKAIYDMFMRRSQANGTETLAVSDAGNTTTSFKVTPGTATTFRINEYIRVTTTSGFNLVSIIGRDVVNDILTVDTAMSDIPVSGDEVITVIDEAGVFGNGNTGTSINTGDLYNRVNGLQTVKNSDVIFLLEAQFIITTS